MTCDILYKRLRNTHTYCMYLSNTGATTGHQSSRPTMDFLQAFLSRNIRFLANVLHSIFAIINLPILFSSKRNIEVSKNMKEKALIKVIRLQLGCMQVM